MAENSDTDWTVDKWNKWYKNPDVENYLSKEVDKYLLKYEERLSGVRGQHKMYFPLCGYTYDMKWAYDKGYEVVGIDCVVPALRKFFENHGLPYTEESVDSINGVLLQSNDKRIRLYGCDIAQFKSDLELDCTAVWDSAAIVALNKGLRPGYCDLTKSMLVSGGRCIITAVDYDGNKYPGPPHRLSLEEIKELFAGTWPNASPCLIRTVEYRKCMTSSPSGHQKWLTQTSASYHQKSDGYDFEVLERIDMVEEMKALDDEESTGVHHHGQSSGSNSKGEKSENDLLREQFNNLEEVWFSYILITKY